MTDLLNKQTVLQHSIERARENFKKVGKANLTPTKIRTRISVLTTTWTQYQEGHIGLLGSIAEASRSNLDYFRNHQFELTEELYQTTLEYMNECLNEMEPIVSPNQSLNTSVLHTECSALSFSQLPQIRMPPFDGSHAEWENFRDRFSALIIQNQSLNDFARMHYLASSLKGRALDSISNVAITAENFEIAWQALTTRYENKRRIITSHFLSLFDLNGLHRESASDLQALCDKVNIAVASLRGLNRSSSDLWNDFLVHLVSQKLDPATRKAWNLRTSDATDPPTYEELNRYLSSRVRALEDFLPSAAAKPSKSSHSRVHTVMASGSAKPGCPLCNSHHYLNSCVKFTAQNPAQRRETAKRYKRCFNCLSASHSLQESKSKFNCRFCQRRHHSMLHIEPDSASRSASSSSSDAKPASTSPTTRDVASHVASSPRHSRVQVLLATASVRISAKSGRSVTVRALVDQGSEATFISESLAQMLRAKRIRMPTKISAIGGSQIGSVKQAVDIIIHPRDSPDPSLKTKALVLSSLTSYTPRRAVDLGQLKHLKNLLWADANPTGSDPIHILIGADLYSNIMLEGIKRGNRRQPFAQNSIFGWIISGPLEYAQSTVSNHMHINVHHCSPLNELETSIKRFWEIEDVPTSQILAPVDEKCELHFRSTHTRDSDGRYIVRLPFKTEPPIDIGSSRRTCEHLMLSLSRRFAVNPELHDEYVAFMHDYESLGHMTRVIEPLSLTNQIAYIPHHPVFRPSSVTTRLRVVFNASSSTSNGTSINDHLLAGPKLQTELPAILLKWRQHRYVYTADIAKMYRQILVDTRDRDYQRILWQPDPSAALHEYQLNTVTYGMNCAPFLALRTIKCLTDDEGAHFPLAVSILRDQIYVDDVLFGDHDRDSLRLRRDQLVTLLRRGRFELRKWASNSSELLSDINPENHGLACTLPLAPDDKLKVLGIAWIPSCEFPVQRGT